jgi:hypothetical protein
MFHNKGTVVYTSHLVLLGHPNGNLAISGQATGTYRIFDVEIS